MWVIAMSIQQIATNNSEAHLEVVEWDMIQEIDKQVNHKVD